MVRRQRRWKLVLPIVALIAALGGFRAPLAVSASEGIDVSSMNQTHGIATGVSKNGNTVCVAWSQFGVASAQAWVRILDVLGGTWNPALGSTAFQVSNAVYGGAGGTRCAFDSNNNLHVVWQQKTSSGSLEIMHRFRNSDHNWSEITQVSGNGDAPDLAADDDGRVWLVYHKYRGDNVPGEVRLLSWLNGWSPEEIFRASGAGGEPRVGVDNAGYVNFAFKNGNRSRGYAYYNSTDNTFSAEAAIPGSSNAGNFSLTVDPGTGDVHVAYIKDSNGIYYAKKAGPGATAFGVATRIVEAAGNSYDARIAWSPGQLIVVFDNDTKGRIDYVTSVDQGAHWGSTKTLASPDGGAQAAWVSADPELGKAYVAYAHGSSSTVYFTSLRGFVLPEDRCASFADVHQDDSACAAIAELTRQNIIRGYGTTPPTFGPDDDVQRAQVSAFIVRALQWRDEPKGSKGFTDFGALAGELRDSSLVLANKCDGNGVCVASGYDSAACASKGKTYPCFGPNDKVSYAQVISFVSRALKLDEDFAWQSQPNGDLPYSGVPTVHQRDVRTYHFYAGTIPDAPSTQSGWNQPAPRAWVALVLYQALQSAQNAGQ
ncbi:MAG: S-layer homology domain-containing protein [Chloroflexia bacterium]